MIKRLLLLPVIIVLSIYLFVLALIHCGYLPQDFNLSVLHGKQQQVNQLKRTYKLLHLKRLILEEQHAILKATIKINQLIEQHHELKASAFSIPSLAYTPIVKAELTQPKTQSKEKIAHREKTDQPLKKSKPDGIKVKAHQDMTQQEKKSYQDLNQFIAKKNTQATKLELTTKEQKSYDDLNHFIEEKKSSHNTHLSTDEKWLLATPGKLFTIQIFGAADEKTAKDFVKQHHIHQAHLFHTYYLNRSWVAVVVGKFANYNQALKQLSSYPHGDQPPWIRPISSIHSAIKLYR